MISDEMLCSRQVFILVVSVLIDSVSTVTSRTTTFTKVLGPNPSIGALGAGREESSLMKCAVSCVQLDNRCFAFTYDDTSTLCTVGGSVSSTSPYTLEPPLGSLYASTICDVNAGFGIYSQNVTTCLSISTSTAVMSEAQRSCEEKGGHLVTTRTREKLNIVGQIARAMNKKIWIGVDDRLVEDEFRWHDDGSVMTTAQRAEFFHPGEPNNAGPDEDCVRYDTYYKLDDASCSNYHHYICERDPSFP